MLASDPASILNQNRTDLGIPNRFNPKESDSSSALRRSSSPMTVSIGTPETVSDF